MQNLPASSLRKILLLITAVFRGDYRPLSPVLANLFLHYALDRWLTVRHPDIPFCRYADDGILRCRSEREAQYLHSQLDMREVDPIAIHRDAQQTSILACVCPGCSDKSPSAPC